MSVNTDESQVRSISECILIIGMPFPLHSQLTGIELVTVRRCFYRVILAYIGLFITGYWFATTIAVLIFSNYRPVVYPLHRVQVNDTPIHGFILKVNEPGFPCLRVNPCALVGTIDVGRTLRHDNLLFIRTVYIPRTQY